MIVRDEERFLGGCLESLRGFVDEIVVVDTGSTDRTCEIAREHGAAVHRFAWRDDFAAARNHALEQASGDWLLYIDADERLRPMDRAALDRELADPALCAARLRFHPRTGFTAYRELRLFRRHPDIRFDGRIHETMMPSIERLVAEQGAVMGLSELTIDHLGYDGGTAHKHERDLRLLVREVEVDPDRAYLWWHLGSIHRERGDLPEAERLWLEGVAAARRARRKLPEQSLCFVELARQRLLQGKAGEALGLIEEVRALQGSNHMLDCLEARALIDSQQTAKGLAIFERLAGIDPDSLVDEFAYDRNMFGAGALAEAALCLFRSGHYGDSTHWYSRALAMAPDNLEFKAKHALAAARSRKRRVLP